MRRSIRSPGLTGAAAALCTGIVLCAVAVSVSSGAPAPARGSVPGGRGARGAGRVGAPAGRGGAAGATVFGVLDARPRWLAQDHAAGIRLVTLNVDWARWQPTSPATDPRYRRHQAEVAAQYRAHGFAVAVDVGLQDPPAWVLALPGGQLVDQRGRRAGIPDIEFNQQVRDKAFEYIHSVVAAMGPVQYYRVGLGSDGEMLYPDPPAHQRGQAWWAFGPQAQGATGGRPPGVGATPMPGWLPGRSTWRSQPVTTAQVRAWYGWYVGALANGLRWEIDAYRLAGFGRMLQLVMPGDGAGPSAYRAAIARHLALGRSDPYHTMSTGALYWRLLDQLPLSGTEVDISSVGDASGLPGRVDCQAADHGVPLARADPAVSGWSDTRWLTYLAGRHRLPAMGENPGSTPPADLARIMGLVQTCHLTALQWAWDAQLHRRSRSLVSIGQLAAAIRAVRSGRAPPASPRQSPAR